MNAKLKTPLLLTVGTAVTLIIGGATAYWFLTQRQQLTGELPVGATILPQEVLATISLSTNGGQWQRLQEFGTAETQAVFATGMAQISDRFSGTVPNPAKVNNLTQLRDRFLQGTGLNYNRDIQPWVGQEATFAFFAPKAPLPNSNPPSASQGLPEWSQVMVLPIANPSTARQVLERQNPQNPPWIERDYKGVQIREKQATDSPQAVTVLDGRFLVMGSNPQIIERVIDTYKGSPSLSTTPGVNQALSRIQTPTPLAKLYINLPEATVVTSENSAQPLSPEQLTQARQNQGMAAMISLAPEGLQVRGVSWLHPRSEKQYSVDNNAKSMPTRLPADTILMASGGNLQQLWQNYSQSANPNAQWLKTAIAQTTNLNLETDLLKWMTGEFALALVPAPANDKASLPVALVLLTQASDRRAADQTFAKLDQVMQERYPFKVEKSNIGERPVVNWTLDVLKVTRGWLDGNVAFLTLGAPIAQSLLTGPKPSFADSDRFLQQIPQDLDPNNGHFYVDVERLLYPQLLLPINLPPTQMTFLSAIRSIGVTAAVENSRTSRFDILVNLRRGAVTPNN